ISDRQTGTYHISRPPLPTSIERSTDLFFDLPNHAGRVLAWLSFDEPPDYFLGYCSTPEEQGLLTLWQTNASLDVQLFFTTSVCGDHPLELLIRNNSGEIHTWVGNSVEPGGELIAAVYRWSEDLADYVLIEPPPEYWT